jgi:hypothetical protein
MRVFDDDVNAGGTACATTGDQQFTRSVGQAVSPEAAVCGARLQACRIDIRVDVRGN